MYLHRRIREYFSFWGENLPIVVKLSEIDQSCAKSPNISLCPSEGPSTGFFSLLNNPNLPVFSKPVGPQKLDNLKFALLPSFPVGKGERKVEKLIVALFPFFRYFYIKIITLQGYLFFEIFFFTHPP
jgi:hypothetical protein